MALSQIQCLDDNHVNPRTHESKPEFLYCEDQRLALEALLRDGREAFVKYLGARGIRGFLSDPELETLAEALEPYDPGSELFPENPEDDEPPVPLSLHYWPELSDTSVPQMDLGWPDTAAYRGVTRTTVYTQPPLEGQVHIKEVVRKMIAQAQKVIAVVMDVFTDVDIFRDLLDAGFKRKVSVYILLERTTLPHFRSMCQRANMHAGHLKHLRVRCTDGAEFHTRSCTKVRGRMGHRFMFVDGDKAVSGSYSFTWMSSRLDKSLITVVTGQAVEAFDRQFRILYATSNSVDLRQVATEPEPLLEPLSQPASVVLPSAAIARKLYSPKYALVALGNPSTTLSADPKETQEDSKNPETKKRRRRRVSKEAIQEVPPLHPALTNLEKACLMSYLPTWPEPDPPSDVIGFINIRDARKPTQVHLQRSEMFETSQAIRFSSPFSMPKETMPETAKPRQLTATHEEIDKLRLAQDKTKESVGVQPTQLNAGPADIKNKSEAPGQKGPKCESDKDATKTLNNENKRHSITPTNHDAHTPRPSSSKVSAPNTGRPSYATQTAAPLLGSNTKKETNLNTQCAAVYRNHGIESSGTQEPHLRPPTDWNSITEPHTQTRTMPPHTDSHTWAGHTQPHHSSEMTPNTQTPAVNSHTSSSTSAKRSQSVSSTSTLTENSPVSVTTTTTSCASISSSSSTPPLTSSSTTPNPPLPSSSASPLLTSTPPVPKPRTVQLVIKGGVNSDSQKLPEVSVVRKPETTTGPLVVHNLATIVQKLPEKATETVPTAAQKHTESTLNIGEAPPQKQRATSRERQNEEADERKHERAGMQLDAGNEAKSDVSIPDVPKAERVNIQETIPKDVEPIMLTSVDCKLTPQLDGVATVLTETKTPERAQAPNESTEDVIERKTYLARVHVPQRISYGELTAQDIDALETVKAPTHTPVSATHTSKDTQGQQSNPSFMPAHHTDSMPNTAKHNSTFQVQVPKAQGTTNTPERPLRIHLPDMHMPDLRSPTPERESRLLAALMCSPTTDGYPPRTPTPDSQMHTPDPRSCTPDFRTPTSDGYWSPRTDSALSTTSDEYYECCESPLHEPVVIPFCKHGTTEDHVSFTNTANATTVIASHAYLNSYTHAASLGTTDSNTSNSETQSLSGPASVSSLSSLLERNVKIEEETETANKKNGREEDEKGRKLSMAKSSTEGDYQGITADPFKEGRGLIETVRNKETQPQVPKRKRVLNQSATEKPINGGVTPGELINQRTEPKRLSTGDPQAKKSSSERKRPDKEKAVDGAALGPSGVERRERPRSADRQKLLQTPPRSPRGQQQDSAPSSPSRPSRTPRPFPTNQALGSRPWGSRQLNHADSKVIHGSLQALNSVSSPRRPPSRPPPPATAGAVGLAAGRRQPEVSHSYQSLLSRQPPAAQGRTRAGQSQNQNPYPKPQASFLHTHSNRQEQLQPHSQKQTVSQREAHWQEEGKAPFSFTFSKLYSLKGLKDKMSKLPAQSKRSSASSPDQGRKSTS